MEKKSLQEPEFNEKAAESLKSECSACKFSAVHLLVV